MVYFVRRIFALLRNEGLTGFITTNSIKDGDNREDGLDQVISQGGEINMVVRGVKWPGRANLVVSLVSVHKGPWKRPRTLDGMSVEFISSRFEDTADAFEPKSLADNCGKIGVGSYFLGDGFLLSHEAAKQLVTADQRNQEVIFPVINGQEMNSDPEQQPGRSIINFFDWNIEKAAAYSKPFEIIERLVKPERQKLTRAVRRDRWWQYAERAVGLYAAIRSLPRCFVTTATTKYLSFSVAPTTHIFTTALFVLATDRWDIYAVVQSTLHEVWARKYSGALETRLRYSPSDCFETFPFPECLWQTANPVLADLGERYHEHRRALMRQLWLGLTDIYNLFHTRDLTPAQVAKVSKKSVEEAAAGYHGILELRRLHRELDISIRDAYGWSDLNLGHDFIEVETLPENDRVRYTIRPAARKEVLKRLLAFNHQRAAAEALAMDAIAPAKRKRGKKAVSTSGELFGDEQLFPLDGREAFVYALIPHLVRERPGMQFEFYRDAALLASHPQRCATLLLDDVLCASYSQAVRNLASLKFPDGQRIRPDTTRETLQRKQFIKTDAKTGATTVQSMASPPSLPKGLEPIMPLILQAADNMDKMQRGALGRAEAEKIALTKEALDQEFEQLMAA